MATSNASSFNSSIGGLRSRSNNDAQFQKAMSDRMAMLKFDAPSALQAQTGQTQAKLGSIQGFTKGVSDIRSTGQKVGKAYDEFKAVGNKVKSAVGDVADAVNKPFGTGGIQDLLNKKLPNAKIRVKTKTTTSAQPDAPTIGGGGGTEGAGKTLGPGGEQQPTQTNLKPLPADEAQGANMGGSGSASQGDLSLKSGGSGLGDTQAADITRTLDPTLQTATTQATLAPKPTIGGQGGEEDSGKSLGPGGTEEVNDDMVNLLKPNQGISSDIRTTQNSLIDAQRGSSASTDFNALGSMSGDSAGARAFGSRSRSVAGGMSDMFSQGGGGKSPLSVSSMIGDQSANNALADSVSSLRTSATAGVSRMGANADTSTNVHASISQALDDFKGQIGGAFADVQGQIGNLSGQVSAVGRGVAGVGDDIVNAGSKVASGVSAGLETAGAVADALGPIGDLIGLGMSIFGGIEARKEHNEQVAGNQQAQAQLAKPVASNTSQATSVSLDTSKQAQAGVMSHY
tara:strand:- start:21076 stop:22614 length:1539 start_codon:yes stop_codon:yes gene_type:complete